MFFNEKLHQKYLEELQTLEHFKAQHARHALGKFQDLSDDPYTRHLIEAMAFFTARNRIQGEQKIICLYRRIFRQYFPYLCHPLPSMGMVQLTPSLDQSESIDLREGTELRFTTGEGKKAYFQTIGSKHILPIRAVKTQFIPSETGFSKFYLQFTSSYATNEKIGEFKLFINCLNHYPSSLSLKLALLHHLKKVDVAYDSPDLNMENGASCSFDFPLPEECKLFHHPVEQIRSQIHCPEQELFLNLQVPDHAKKWRSFTLCFYLSSPWPIKFQLSKESLLPFVIPIVNLKRKPSAPIRCDGTKECYPILYPDPEDEFSLHRIAGVYRIEKHKMLPLKPAILYQGNETYEIEEVLTQQHKISPRLSFNFVDAFEHPKIISADTLWHQPWFSHDLEKELKLTILNPTCTSLETRVLGKLYPTELQSGLDDIHFLIRLLGLKNQDRLELDDLLILMDALKPQRHTYFKEISSFIKDFQVHYLPTFRNALVSDEYQFFLEKMDDKNRDLALVYFQNLKNFLHIWLTGFEVEVSLISPQFKTEGIANETSLLV